MSEPYTALAPIYDTLSLGQFAEVFTPLIIDYAQRTEWMGRRVTDLGCGTAVNFPWLVERGYRMTGIDQSEAMLAVAQRRIAADDRLSADFVLGDMRIKLAEAGPADLILALNVLNEINGLRDLEMLFRAVAASLEPGKLFAFDLHTIQGLISQARVGDQVVHDQDGLAVYAQVHFDFERQILERHDMIYQRAADASWGRSDARRALRGFPLLAVASLLGRCGLSLRQVLDLNFNPLEPGVAEADRVIFIAEK